MKRLLLCGLLSIGLLLSGIAMISSASAVETPAGYEMTAWVNVPTIYVYPDVKPRQESELNYLFPPSATLTVSVKDANGNPVAGVPVQLKVEPDSMLKGMITITPQGKTTNVAGQVEAIVRPTSSATTGEGDVAAWVDGKSEDVSLSVQLSPRRAY